MVYLLKMVIFPWLFVGSPGRVKPSNLQALAAPWAIAMAAALAHALRPAPCATLRGAGVESLRGDTKGAAAERMPLTANMGTWALHGLPSGELT